MVNQIEREDCVGIIYRNAYGRRIVRNGVITSITSTTIRLKRLNTFGNVVYTPIRRSRIVKIVILED